MRKIKEMIITEEKGKVNVLGVEYTIYTNDIQFFYDLGIYSDADLDFYVVLGYITADEKEQIKGK